MDNEALIAVKKGNLTKLKKQLTRGINVNARDAKQRTLLHHATSNSEHKIVECLLRNGADVLAFTEKSNTVLHLAVSKSDESMTKVILENVTRDKVQKLLNVKTKANGMTALHLAAKRDSCLNAFMLLERGANFEIANDAGEKSIDVARGMEVPQLLRLITESFAKAKRGDDELAADLEKCNSLDLTGLLNCRDNEGHTLMQILVLNQHYDLANQVLWLRVNQKFQRELNTLHDIDHKSEVEELAKDAREFKDFWTKQKEDMEKFLKNARSSNVKSAASRFGQSGLRALEMAHGVLSAYRGFEVKTNFSTTNPQMKTLEETLEVLGFDVERMDALGGGDARYEKLPYHLKKNVSSLVRLVDCVVSASVEYLLHYMNVIRIFNAVKDDDLEKMQQLLGSGLCVHPVDHNFRSPLCYAAEKGSKKMVKLLLKYNAKVFHELAESPVYLAVSKRHAKIVKLLLQHVDAKELAEIIDRRGEFGQTALHMAAFKGRLDIVKILLRHGATYRIFDLGNRTPFDIAENEEISEFLKLVDDCFHEAKEAKVELVYKLKAMQTDDFLAIASTKNEVGQTLAVVAAKANAKSIAGMILRMIREATKNGK